MEIAKGAQLARSAGRRSIWREALDLAGFDDRFLVCNRCAGYGLIPIPVAQIVARAAEEARRFYWPALEARWADFATGIGAVVVTMRAG